MLWLPVIFHPLTPMINKQEFNQPLCMVVVSIILGGVSFASKVAVLVLQITNNQLFIVKVTNASYLSSLNDLNSVGVCPASTVSSVAYSPMSYYKYKFRNLVPYLSFANAITAITVILLVFVLVFLVVLGVNINRKTQKCMTQIRSKQTSLGCMSLAIVTGASMTGYLISFYVQTMSLNCPASGNITTFQQSFFVEMLLSGGGSLINLVNYFLVLFLKVMEPKEGLYEPANNTEMPTLYNQDDGNLLQMGSRTNQRPQYQDNKEEGDLKIYTDRRREALRQRKEAPPKPDVYIEEVMPQDQKERVNQTKKEKIHNGILRMRPPKPTDNPIHLKSYPKFERPNFIPKEIMRERNEDYSRIIREVQNESINRRLTDSGEMVVNDSRIEEVDEDIG